MTNSLVVDCRGVGKRYGQHWAVQQLDLCVREGEIFGLLGPNGAGKTTLIKVLLGLVLPTRGAVKLCGLDLFRRRNAAIRRVGAVVEAPVFFEYLSARENLRHLVALSGGCAPQRLEEALATVGLGEVNDRPVRTFSYGMKQRLGIAQALLPESRLLILDEPTNGLDPHGIAGIRELVRRLAGELGMTILLCSHLLIEVEQLCDRVAILSRGRKVLEGDVDELVQSSEILVVVRRHERAASRLGELGGGGVQEAEGEVRAVFPGGREVAAELAREVVGAGLELVELRPCNRSLEDVFLAHAPDGEGAENLAGEPPPASPAAGEG